MPPEIENPGSAVDNLIVGCLQTWKLSILCINIIQVEVEAGFVVALILPPF